MARQKTTTAAGERRSGKATSLHPNVKKRAVISAQRKTPSEIATVVIPKEGAGSAEEAPLKKTRKSPKFKHSTIARREIKKAQKCTHAEFPRATMNKICRELARDTNAFGSVRFKQTAIDALHAAASQWLTHFLKEGAAEAQKAGRVTLMAEDIAEARRLHLDRNTMESMPPVLPIDNVSGCREEARQRTEAAVETRRARNIVKRENREADKAVRRDNARNGAKHVRFSGDAPESHTATVVDPASPETASG